MTTITSITDIKMSEDETLGPILEAKVTYEGGQVAHLASQCRGSSDDLKPVEQLELGLERILAMALRRIRRGEVGP